MPSLWAPLGLLLTTLLASGASSSTEPQIHSYMVVAEYPHDPNAFTQGLQFDHWCNESKKQCVDIFWESTGMYGQSTVRKVVVATGEVVAQTKLKNNEFGEGLVKLGSKLYQLLWQTGEILVYDAESLKLIQRAQGPLKDGWGLATDGKHLIATDSSAQITWFDPETFKKIKSVTAMDGDKPIKWLNELEMIGNELWANVWQTECIARVDVATGQIKHWIMLHGLRSQLLKKQKGNGQMDVLNGIAYDFVNKRIYITGKNWPMVFEMVPAPLDGSNITLPDVRVQCHPPGW